MSFELKLLERNISSDGLGGVAAKVGEVSDMRENEVGIGGGESGCGIVAREEGDGGELSRTGRMDVMNHVSYVGGRSWVQLVAGEDFDNSFPLVDDARVDALEGGGHAEALGLSEESFFVHAGEDEEAKPFLLRSGEEVSGIGEGGDEVFGLEEGFFEEDLEFLERHFREMLGVESVVGEAEVFLEALWGEGVFSVMLEDRIGSGESGLQVVDEGSRPVENEIVNGAGHWWGGFEGFGAQALGLIVCARLRVGLDLGCGRAEDFGSLASFSQK